MREKRGPAITESDDQWYYAAAARIIDFRDAWGTRHYRDENGRMIEELVDDRPRSSAANPQALGRTTDNAGLLMTRTQSRARVRRAIKAGRRIPDNVLREVSKPLDEWDEEELARGRPRDAAGGFRGAQPEFITREIHERALERFKLLIREGMNVSSFTALRTIQMVLESDSVDYKGKPIVSAAQKLDAAKFLLEHVVGKPTQPTTTDISVKLQGILGAVMVNPAEIGDAYNLAHRGGRLEITDYIDAEVEDDD